MIEPVAAERPLLPWLESQPPKGVLAVVVFGLSETEIESVLCIVERRCAERDLAPLLLTDTHWFTHGFGDDLDAAMAMAADQALRLLVDRGGFTIDEAYSLASVAVDFGVTQVVDGTLGCHAAIARELLEPQG